MQMKVLFHVVVLMLIFSGPVSASQSSSERQAIDTTLALQYFQEAEAICKKDNGKLWGVSLCGPMLFVDRATRTVVANQADPEGHLKKDGQVFVGRLPEKELIANTSTRWAGAHWTMLIWPLPENKEARAKLMAHELFHRIQEQIGLPASNPSNNHLDSMEGRTLLQLEWRALRSALARSGAERRAHATDALVFRSHRRALFPEASPNERGLEMNEGVAEYTGFKLRGTADSESILLVVKQLENWEGRPSFVRSFAYASGPAYGFLLDAANANWRGKLKPEDDLGALTQKFFSIELPGNLKEEAEKRSAKYEGGALRASEVERENKRLKRLADYRARFVDGPVLVVPLTDQVQYSFDPGNIEAFDESASVYPNIRVSDDWGILTVTKGALVSREGRRVARVHVPAPADANAQKLEGDGWTLELSKGWILTPGERKGDYYLKQTR